MDERTGQMRDAKLALRRDVLSQRPAAEPEAAAGAVARVLDLPEMRAARVVAAFVAMAGEPSVDALVDAVRARGCRVLLPVLRADAALDWREYDGRLVDGRRGTREPPADAPAAALDTADVVVVPGVAFDTTGRRLGRGGGSYDRALATARPDALVVGVTTDAAVVDRVPAEAHDRLVDIVVTPTRVVRCGRSG